MGDGGYGGELLVVVVGVLFDVWGWVFVYGLLGRWKNLVEVVFGVGVVLFVVLDVVFVFGGFGVGFGVGVVMGWVFVVGEDVFLCGSSLLSLGGSFFGYGLVFGFLGVEESGLGVVGDVVFDYFGV